MESRLEGAQAWRDQQRALFDVPDHVTYLNSASLAPRLRAVSAAGYAAVDRMAAPWQIQSDDWFSGALKLEQLFAGLIGANPGSVVIVPSVSYGVATAAQNVPIASGDNIVVVNQEYPSNYYSWRRAALTRGAEMRVAVAATGAGLADAIVSLIDQRTAVVAVPICRWTDGVLIDLERVADAARRHDAALVVDASQAIGAYPFDVAAVKPDFLVTVGYKWLLGPYGLGYLYVGERWHTQGMPLEESWLNRRGSENLAALVDYTDEYKPGAQRFRQGESAQHYLLPMAIAALTQISHWTPARIQEQLRDWTNELARRVAPLGLQTGDPAQRVGHMIGLRVSRGVPPDLVSGLAARDVHVAVRGDSIRVAPHLHSGAQDMERLVQALTELLR